MARARGTTASLAASVALGALLAAVAPTAQALVLAAPRSALAKPASVLPASVPHRDIPTFEINLDLAPEQRYLPLFAEGLGFNATVWKFWEQYFARDFALRDALYLLADIRGPEPDEQQAEVEGLVALSRLPLKFVQAIQMLYELQTLMVPSELNGTFVDTTAAERALPVGLKALARIPWRGPGCTGIIAQCTDGAVWHARNLDFSPADIMVDLVYNARFTRNGQELFQSQMVAGYTQIVTAAVGFATGDGYVIERNTRFPDHEGGNEQMLKNLLEERRPLNGWQLRQIATATATFDAAVAAVSAAPYVSTEYAIMSGVQKGTVLAKDPDRVAHTQTLGVSTGDGQRSDFIIMTNFDFFFGDRREYFDPTAGGGIGKPTRRQEAERLLNDIPVGALTPQALFETINAPLVRAKDTVFQALASAEKGVWNVSQPYPIQPVS